MARTVHVDDGLAVIIDDDGSVRWSGDGLQKPEHVSVLNRIWWRLEQLERRREALEAARDAVRRTMHEEAGRG